MKFKVIDKFIDTKICNKLIEDAERYCENDHIQVLNKRLLLPSTSIAFINLLKKSKTWSNLHQRLNSQNFLSEISLALGLGTQNFEIKNFFFKENYSFFHKKYKEINLKKIANVSSLGLIYYLLIKIYRNFIRVLRFKFTKKNYVELLYDYSKSPNGYHREIHRDSDSRTIVFLLYLNELSDKATGGDLCFYKFNNSNKKISPQPNKKDCALIKSIAPVSGRLVVFLNSFDSLHSVNEMKDHLGYRHFLYGSFTLLAKKNILVNPKNGQLKTNYTIFE